jgi:hypothetical protein
LSLSDCQNIIAEFTVEVFDLLLEAKSAKPFHALDADIHFFLDELSTAPTFVVYIRCPKFGKPIHFKYYKYAEKNCID